MIALIGGTGVYDKIFDRVKKKTKIKTPYGLSPEIYMGEMDGTEVAFLPRHGETHAIPPHKINYRANIYALKKLGAERIIATNSVGAINESIAPMSIVIPHDFVDLTDRESTFYDNKVVHVDFSHPYCPELRKALLKAAERVAHKIYDCAVYACTEGPRFETPAEIRMLRSFGCDIVGMTGVPEVVLAKEQEMCFASIATVTNYAAGISKKKLTVTEVLEITKQNQENIRNILAGAVKNIPKIRRCDCRYALKGAKI